ncbi:Uncharacterised protein [Serratia odorifera]|uniref:Uncharacterized protein n=1 Tax=Serratia odorifera TaxID=618 RepID=A0A447KQR8_SEROD|nr:Uncharacterised protein [Serratia odorifera]
MRSTRSPKEKTGAALPVNAAKHPRLLAPTAAVKYGGSELLCFPLGGDGSALTPFPATLVFPYANRRPIQPLNGLIIID